MAAMLLVMMGLSLLMQSCFCSPEQRDRSCDWWKPTPSGQDVCCEKCLPGYRLVKKCGPRPKELCTPCELGTFTVNPTADRCTTCTQCAGAQIQLKACTTTSDTQCGCKEGLVCGDDRCSFCVDKCAEGHEPTDDGSCRPCPKGTFNDKSHQKCKPWSTECPKSDQTITSEGDAFNDIKCDSNVSKSTKRENPDHTEQAWSVAAPLFLSAVLMTFTVVIIVVAVKVLQKRKKSKKPLRKDPIIRPPTDDPRTLIAIECSFHEAQQEQGSSSESLDSKDSSEQLIR